MDGITPSREQPGKTEADGDIQDDDNTRPGMSGGKLIAGLAAGAAAVVGGGAAAANAFNAHVDRPVEAAVQVTSQHQSEHHRIAGFNEGGVRFEMTPEGNVAIILPKNLIKQLDGWDGKDKKLDATIENADGTSQSVDVVAEGYRGLGHYPGEVTTETKNAAGEVVSAQENPDNWREMTATPEPGGVPSRLDISIDGSEGPHSEYTIVEPPQAPAEPTG